MSINDPGVERDIQWLNGHYRELSPGERLLADLCRKFWVHIEGLHRELAETKHLVAKQEELLMHHSLDIENNGVNVDALLEENKRLQGQINSPRSHRVGLDALLDRLASQCGHFENAINHLAGRVAELEKRSQSHEDTLSRLAIRVGDLESAVSALGIRVGELEAAVSLGGDATNA